MTAPATPDEFYRTLPTERRCWDALRRLRWADGFRCPRSEDRKAHRLRGRGLWPCAGCRYQASLAPGTPFHGTRVPLRTGFLAIFFVARPEQGISALQLQRDAGLGSYKAAWMLLQKVRSTLAHNPLFPLRGEVEVDETSVGGDRSGWNGRGVGKTGMAIAVERRGGLRTARLPGLRALPLPLRRRWGTAPHRRERPAHVGRGRDDGDDGRARRPRLRGHAAPHPRGRPA